jgi:hypothetical protein
MPMEYLEPLKDLYSSAIGFLSEHPSEAFLVAWGGLTVASAISVFREIRRVFGYKKISERLELEDFLYKSAAAGIQERALAYLGDDEFISPSAEFANMLIGNRAEIQKAIGERSKSRLYKGLTNFSHSAIFRGAEEPKNSEETLALLEADLQRAAEYLGEDGHHRDAVMLAKPWRKEWKQNGGGGSAPRILPRRAMALAQAAVDELSYETSVIVPGYDYERNNRFLAALLERSMNTLKPGDAPWDADTEEAINLNAARMEALGEFSRFAHI